MAPPLLKNPGRIHRYSIRKVEHTFSTKWSGVNNELQAYKTNKLPKTRKQYTKGNTSIAKSDHAQVIFKTEPMLHLSNHESDPKFLIK